VGPVFAGAAWNGITEAKLRLVLEVPLARDVVDEAEIIVRPVAEATESTATS
jgi:hypothetical protein